MKAKVVIFACIILILGGVIVTMGIFHLGASFKEINDERLISLKDVETLQVYLQRESVRIIVTDAANDVKLHYHGKSKQQLELACDMNDKVLNITGHCKSNPLPRDFDPTPEDMHLDIYLPKHFSNSISIRTTIGTVTMDSINLDRVTIDTTIGGIEAKQLIAKDISLKTTVGGINIDKMQTENVQISGTTSPVSMNELNASSAKIATTTGDITLNLIDVPQLNVKTTVGTIRASYQKFDHQTISASTTTGSTILELPHTAEFSLKAETKSGSIQTDFNIQATSNTKNRLEGQLGQTDNMAQLKSSSGNIRVLKMGS